MRYAKLKKTDIANGPGVRVSFFVSGCRKCCRGCFNTEAQDFEYGEPYNALVVADIFDALEPDYIAGLSILGGEPLEPENYPHIAILCQHVKQAFPDKTIWLYTGFEWEKIQHFTLWKFVDVVVDGPYIDELRDISLAFKGSKNQKIIDVQKSLKTGNLELWRKNNAD